MGYTSVRRVLISFPWQEFGHGSDSDTRLRRDFLQRRGNGGAEHERPSAKLSRDRFGGDRSIGKGNALVAGAPRPFKPVLKRMPVNRLDVLGVQIACGAISERNFQPTRNDVVGFEALEFGMARCANLVLDGDAVRDV